MSKVAIIGAGMAGLTALQALSAEGHEVTVFDKSRGSGGRLATKKVGSASWDMGAQFMRAHTDEFAAQIAEWEAKGWVALWDMQPHAINKTGIHPSPDDVNRYVGVSRMTALSRHLLEAAAHFIPRTRIERCEFKDNLWTLHSEEGECFPGYDALVINAPPAQAKALATGQISQDIIAQMDANWTLLLSFDGALPTEVNAAYVKDSPIAWVARNNSKPQRDEHVEAWVIQASAEWSNACVDAPRMNVQAELQAAFFDVLGIPEQKIIERWLHRWLYAIPNKKSDQAPLSDASRKVCVCGDWFDKGAVEGAFLSGRATGQAMLDILRKT